MATTESNGNTTYVPIWNSREPDRVVLDTAKTLAPYCSLQHLVKGDIVDALNNNSEITGGNILLTNIEKVVDQLKERKLLLAPGATLGLAPDRQFRTPSKPVVMSLITQSLAEKF